MHGNAAPQRFFPQRRSPEAKPHAKRVQHLPHPGMHNGKCRRAEQKKQHGEKARVRFSPSQIPRAEQKPSPENKFFKKRRENQNADAGKQR